MMRGTRIATALACLLGLLSGGFGFGAFPDQAQATAALQAQDPLPGQSDQPAPASREKLVLDHGHIDAFTPVLEDGGGLRLAVKEDVTGLNVIREPESLLLHVKPKAMITMPAGVIEGLEGEAYHLPLVQDSDLIWPGWETQLITEQFPNANTGIVVSEVEGPGDVFLWSQDTFGALKSLLIDGGYQLPATISQPYPAHTHAAWAFTEAGTYTLTVRADVTAENGAQASTQTARYTFVVGELADHTVATTTSLDADSTAVEPGEPVTLTATVSPGAGGAVQFRDEASGAILGHTPVGGDGTATFRTAALQPGEHRIVAEFVPTWSNDFVPSISTPVAIEVGGEQVPKPEHDDTVALSETELESLAEAELVQVTSPERTVLRGGMLTAEVKNETDAGALDLRGDWVSVWVHGAAGADTGVTGTPSWLGWTQLDLLGGLDVAVPERLPAGDFRLVLKSRDGVAIGWDRFKVVGTVAPVDPSPPVDPPPPAPVAPTQECLPAVTLDHGHIDAFTVSSGGGLAVLQLLEDVTGHRVLREVETVLLRVKESALSQIPGIPGGPTGYVLPLSQNQSLIWPGWDTNRTTASGYTDVSINVTSVSGPGSVFLYTSQGAFGGWRPILTHGGYTLPGTIHEASPAHTHAQWVFSERGIYVLSAYAVATNPSTGESLTTRSHSYVFQVGDVPLGDVFCGLSAHGAADSAQVSAAVLEAGQQAVSAEQASAKTQKKSKKSTIRNERRSGEQQARLAEAASPLPIAVVAGVVGGGVLLLAGIAGGTFWVLRGVRERDSQGLPGTPDVSRGSPNGDADG